MRHFWGGGQLVFIHEVALQRARSLANADLIIFVRSMS